MAILHLRRMHRMTARMIAKSLDLAISTVARILKRHGIGKISALIPKDAVPFGENHGVMNAPPLVR